MPRQTLQNLLRPTTTPDQLLLLDWFYSQFDFRTAGANRRVANVEPIFFQGAIAGTEFLTYVNTKLYLCYKFKVGMIISSALASPVITFYDAGDTANFVAANDAIVWNATGAAERYIGNLMSIENFYFSRFATAGYTYIIFNGYRVTLD